MTPQLLAVQGACRGGGSSALRRRGWVLLSVSSYHCIRQTGPILWVRTPRLREDLDLPRVIPLLLSGGARFTVQVCWTTLAWAALAGMSAGASGKQVPAVAGASKSGAGDRWGNLHGALEPPAQEECKM